MGYVYQESDSERNDHSGGLERAFGSIPVDRKERKQKWAERERERG